MSYVTVLGVDCGLANFGWAMVRLAKPWEVLALGTIRTKDGTSAAGVTASSDLSRRAREVHRQLRALCDEHGWPSVICAEAHSYPRVPRKGGKACPVCKSQGSSIAVKALAQLNRGWGVVDALANQLHDLPIVEASPQAIKATMCGRANATKGQVQKALQDMFGATLLDGLNKGEREHAADALGAVVACKNTSAMQMARRQAAA